MMHLCNETITVINRTHNVEDDLTAYVKTVIHGASWFGSLKSNVDNSGLKAANLYTVRIDAKNADTGGKTYTNPIDFADNPTEAKFTIANGDIIVRGEVTEADENITPKLIHSNYAEVLTVLSVTDNRRTQNAPHWKVVGA